MLYYEQTSICKREYNQIFESKDRTWRLKYDYKNWKYLNYQADQSQPDQSQPDQSQLDQLVLPKWVKVSKRRFNEIQETVSEVKKNKLNTTTC